jgi:glutathione S-transferase
MKLLGSVLSPYTRKVRIVLAEKKIECEFESVDVNPPDNRSTRHNPLGKVPTLLMDDGTALFDSRVIVEFLDAVSPLARLIPGRTTANASRCAAGRRSPTAPGSRACWSATSRCGRQKEQSAPGPPSRQASSSAPGDDRRELGDKRLVPRRPLHAGRTSRSAAAWAGWISASRRHRVMHASTRTSRASYDKLMERPAFADTAPITSAP